jgi:hypothetical protein
MGKQQKNVRKISTTVTDTVDGDSIGGATR